MKKLLIAIPLLVIWFTGCERVFTTSPFSFLQRDLSRYSDEQAVAYAEDALASGNEDAMAAAFELLADSEDPETQLVAVELALGAAGVETALTDLVAGLAAEGSDPATVVGEALGGFSDEDLALLVSAGDLLAAADDEVSPSAEQYAFVAIGLIAAAADDAGGIDELESPDPGSDAEAYLDQAEDFLTEAGTLLTEEGGSTEILDGFAEFFS